MKQLKAYNGRDEDICSFSIWRIWVHVEYSCRLQVSVLSIKFAGSEHRGRSPKTVAPSRVLHISNNWSVQAVAAHFDHREQRTTLLSRKDGWCTQFLKAGSRYEGTSYRRWSGLQIIQMLSRDIDPAFRYE